MIARFDYEIKENLVVGFEDQSGAFDTIINSYEWDFGDGTAPGEGQLVQHKYARVGIYNVTLTIRSISGDVERYSEQVDLTKNTVNLYLVLTVIGIVLLSMLGIGYLKAKEDEKKGFGLVLAFILGILLVGLILLMQIILP